jgi:hypothetical protein
MSRTKTRQDLAQIVTRIAAQALGLTVAAACAATGYLVFGLTNGSERDYGFSSVSSGLSDASRALLGSDDRLVMILLPGLLIGGLMLGGLYLWNKRGG